MCAQIVFISKWQKQELYKENIVWKIKDKNPSIKNTRQMRAQIDTTQRKNQSKQSTKKGKKPSANKTHGYEMTINDNNENLRWESCCLP